MPLFLKHRLLFIHIPKCGGDTVTHHLGQHGDRPFLFVDDGSVMVNGHTPQHLTWLEILRAGWRAPSDFRVAALVRHPVDRVISEFHYIKAYRPDLADSTQGPTSFLDEFLCDTEAARARFDNHNVGICDFLAGPDGEVDPAIEIYPICDMDRLVGSFGLPPIRTEDRRNVTRPVNAVSPAHTFSKTDIHRIATRYGRDIDWLRAKCPDLRSDWQL
jgi:hypothetical protein